MTDVESLAARVRSHEESPYDGEASQEDVVVEALKQELVRLDSHAELEEKVSEKQEELKADLGLVGETSESDGETAQDDVEAKRAELRDRITGGD
jgi:hypothetical protein